MKKNRSRYTVNRITLVRNTASCGVSYQRNFVTSKIIFNKCIHAFNYRGPSGINAKITVRFNKTSYYGGKRYSKTLLFLKFFLKLSAFKKL